MSISQCNVPSQPSSNSHSLPYPREMAHSSVHAALPRSHAPYQPEQGVGTPYSTRLLFSLLIILNVVRGRVCHIPSDQSGSTWQSAWVMNILSRRLRFLTWRVSMVAIASKCDTATSTCAAVIGRSGFPISAGLLFLVVFHITFVHLVPNIQGFSTRLDRYRA